jgi:hypothetical protein
MDCVSSHVHINRRPVWDTLEGFCHQLDDYMMMDEAQTRRRHLQNEDETMSDDEYYPMMDEGIL